MLIAVCYWPGGAENASDEAICSNIVLLIKYDHLQVTESQPILIMCICIRYMYKVCHVGVSHSRIIQHTEVCH